MSFKGENETLVAEIGVVRVDSVVIFPYFGKSNHKQGVKVRGGWEDTCTGISQQV